MRVVNNGLTITFNGTMGHFPKEFVVSALEKQIPKKPIIHGVRDRDINTISYTCSVCNKHIGIREDYCKNCGNALDWGEEE